MIKLAGVIIIVITCSGFGFWVATSYKNETIFLRQFLSVLNIMECELRYKRSSLPDLCHILVEHTTGSLRGVFLALSQHLMSYCASNAAVCMQDAVKTTLRIPSRARPLLILLGDSLGKYDLDGQLKGIDFVRKNCEEILAIQVQELNNCVRTYKTLGICAGAALAILLL